MADENGDKPPRPARESELLPAMMAIALAVAAQLALQDGLTLLGAAGYLVAAWLFVASVRGTFDSSLGRPAVESESAADQEAVEVEAVQPVDTTNRLTYLRHNWRLVTLAEIFRGDIPPARLQASKLVAAPPVEPVEEADAVGAPAVGTEKAPAAAAAQLQSSSTSESPESTSKAIRVTPQGDVLVLDTGLEQVQRFDETGNLLGTYSVAGLAGMQVMDLAVSPDGKLLYLVDAASSRLQVITLSDDEGDGEEE